MRTIRTLLSISAMSFFLHSGNAQELAMMARSTPDSIVLRWAPLSPEMWYNYNQYGYRLERVEIKKNSSPITVRLSTDTIRPWTLEQFQARFPFEHPFGPAAGQALYGESFAAAPNPANPGSFMDGSREQTLRWSIAMLFADYDAQVATALGLRWVDRTAKIDGKYLYRLIALDPAHPDTALFGIDRTIGTMPPPDNPVIYAEENDGSITLKWPNENKIAPFSGYWIERKDKGGSWKRLNTAPFIHTDPTGYRPLPEISYTDTTIAGNYIAYSYRVIGITAFAEMAEEATVIQAKGRDRTPPPNPIMKEVKDEKGKLVVHWEQPAGVLDLRGFRVEKAPTALSAFLPLHKNILAKSTRQFTDTSSFLMGENHFRVVAIDTAGNESISMLGYGYLIDSIPPLPPTELEGMIDTNGVVTLKWKLGPELDIIGYRVFFANAADHVFNNLSPEPLASTTFIDSIQIRTLTKRIYYRLVAVDRNFNHSGFSKTLVLEKPDMVPPVAPVFMTYQSSDTEVKLGFVPSSSSDVSSHNLLRKSDSDTTWRIISTWPISESRRSYVDKAISGPAYYSYMIQATDSAGNHSPFSVPAEVRINGTFNPIPPNKVEIQQKETSIQVSWKSPLEGVKHYVIYRSKDGSSMSSIASVQANELSYTDIRLLGSGDYRYAVKIVYENGTSSALEESVALTYK